LILLMVFRKTTPILMMIDHITIICKFSGFPVVDS
jgi:hypothetical protein